MYHIKDDKRSIRSAEMLYDGLEILLQDKSFDTIKVKDLVDVSHVGRTTFYRHFDEIEDILRFRCDQVTASLMDYLQEYQQKHPHESNTSILKPLLRYFYLHSDLIELLIKTKRIHIFEASLMHLFEPFKPMFGTFFDIEDDYVDYIVAIRIGSAIKILTHWVETGKVQAPDELADKLSTMIHRMVQLERFV